MTRTIQTVFVTGTGTNVGKTVVAALLARALSETADVTYFKPVQTGPDSDSVSVSALAGRRVRVIPSLFTYPDPLSPDQAAEASGRQAADIGAIAEVIDRTSGEQASGYLIVEGAGGLLVPLNPACDTWLTLIRHLHLPVIVAASPGLGTINHTAMTLKILETSGADLLGVVLSGPVHPLNTASLERMAGHRRFHNLPPVGLSSEDMAALDLPARELARAFRDWNCWLRRTDEAEGHGDLRQLAARHIWAPYTQHQTAPDPLPVHRAQGVWLYPEDHPPVIDGISSWWVNNCGHGRAAIGTAIARQQSRLDHVIFAGVTHRAAADLARRLTEHAGNGLTRCFYSDNGSTAVEVAMKMTYQMWVNRGEPQRTLFVALKGAYHGDTFGCMSVGDSAGFHGVFRPMMFTAEHVIPATSHPSQYAPQGISQCVQLTAAMRSRIAALHQRIAAVIIEPLVQGAAGMLVQAPEYTRAVRDTCREFGLPLIADEVMTGFGRTGAMFACNRAGIDPDIIALSKGITGGTMPLAATLAREDFFGAFLSADKSRALMHGHSYTGNPVACAAALAALDIIENEDLPARARWCEETYHQWIQSEASGLGILNPRFLGGILAFELPGSGFGDYFHKGRRDFATIALSHGLFVRPLGNTAYLMPPLSISESELGFALTALTRAVREYGSGPV